MLAGRVSSAARLSVLGVPAVLVCYGSGIQEYEVILAGRASREQADKMAELADEAFKAWKQENHPGWSVGTMDSRHLQHLEQQQVPNAVAVQPVVD